MAKNISRHITHLKSKVVESNAPKLPAAADLYEGEIAVNYAKGYETLSIKNESGTVVTFKSKDYNDGAYQAKGSYLTGTTNYAGSASQGGAATSANKLNSNAGSATQPIYFSNGVPSACTYTLGKSVPSDAVFTDNNTTYAAGSFITITGTNNSINVTTGTSSTSVARGDHSHSAYVATGRSISTASGLTGGGNLSADRTIGLAATGSAGTYSTVVVDEYGRVTSGNSEGGIDDTKIAFIGDVIGSGDSVTHSSSYVWADQAGQNISQTAQTAIRTAIGAVSSSDVATQISNKVTGVGILTISATTQSAYDVATKDPNVLYVIVDEL